MKQYSRLSESIYPLNYNLFFEPDLENFTFKGKVEIEIKILKPASRIILHSSELKIKSAKIFNNSKELIPRIKTEEKNETLTLMLSNNINNHAVIEIEFQGVLNDKLAGFYRSKYSHKRKEKYLATTQFEAPYARKAFPCFDEPEKKATFALSLLIPKNLKAISNMQIISEIQQNNKKLIKFEKTPLMSTYLLYIGVGEFEFIEDKLNDTLIRVATIPGKSKEGKFALDLAKKFLKYFQDYSRIPYPLPKLDLIAIPDFNAGAMENWGAITFREILLLFDSKKTSLPVKKRIAEVIAHELWHQWSGNLVTMKWWDDLWLNESFATYMAYKAVDNYFPEWKMWEDFVSDSTGGAMDADMLRTTHPIAVKVSSPNEIEEIFDAISYGKGGSVLRMIESYLSPQIFREGINNYLKKYAYKNAKASDLWNSLAKISKSPIKQIMESWITQAGYPIIELKQKGANLTLTQKRFNSEKDQIWKIPLTIKTNKKIIKTLLTKKTQMIKLQDVEWFKLNSNQEGLYRVKYTKEQLEKLKPLISEDKLSPFDKWGIQNDIFNLSLINEIYITEYLDFIKSYSSESNAFVLEDIYANINKTHKIFYEEKSLQTIWPKFRSYMQTPFQKALEKLSWNPNKKEPHNASLLRPLAISYLAFAENEVIIKEGFRKFQQFLESPYSLHPDIKGSVLSIIGRNGTEREYNKILQVYLKTNDIEEKIKLLASLYKSKNPALIKKSLDLSLSKNVRLQDMRTVFSIINSNPDARPILLNWIRQNWNKLEEFKKANFVFISLLEALITSYTGKEKEKEIRKFLKTKDIGFKKTIANSFEIMQLNTKFLESNKKVLENYFS